MELRADLAQRLEYLGRKHDDREAVERRNIAKHEAHADLDSHESHRQGREKLEHAARQERDAQRCHRRLRVGGSQGVQVRARGLLATEAAQRGKPRHQVEELGSQAFHRRELVLRGRLRETSDEDHEDRDEGNDEEGDECGPEVEQKNDAEGRRGHRADEDELREEGHEVGTQVLQARRQKRGRFGALGRPPSRPQGDARFDDTSAQFGHRGGSSPCAHGLAGGDDQRAAREDGCDSRNVGPDVEQRRGARDDGGEGC